MNGSGGRDAGAGALARSSRDPVGEAARRTVRIAGFWNGMVLGEIDGALCTAPEITIDFAAADWPEQIERALLVEPR